MLFAITIFLSLYLREWTPSRPASRGGFHQPVETITAPRSIFYYKGLISFLQGVIASCWCVVDKVAGLIRSLGKDSGFGL